MANISSGCTVTNTFSLPCGEEDIAVLYITYQQNDVTVLEKTKEDCSFEGTTAIVRLSQEDTLKFPQDDGQIRIQLRLRTIAGTAMKSAVLTASPDVLLKQGVI